MANNRLSLYSIVWSEIQDLDSHYDQEVCNADDGENDTVREAKEEILVELQHTIDQLIALKQEIEKEPMKKLKAKYEIQ